MGPLPNIDTITSAISVDVNRLLTLGDDSALKFYKIDNTVEGGWVLLQTVTRNFDKFSDDPNLGSDGRPTSFRVVDLDLTFDLKALLQTKQLYLRLDLGSDEGERQLIYTVDEPAIEEGQVYTIWVTKRAIKSNFTTGRQ